MFSKKRQPSRWYQGLKWAEKIHQKGEYELFVKRVAEARGDREFKNGVYDFFIHNRNIGKVL